jgi:hypothetical protein
LGEEGGSRKRHVGGLDSFREMTAYCSNLGDKKIENMGGGTFRITGWEDVLSLRSVGTR